MIYAGSLLRIVKTSQGPMPVCSCGWFDSSFYHVERAWRSGLLHLAFDFHHEGSSVSQWARRELDQENFDLAFEGLRAAAMVKDIPQ